MTRRISHRDGAQAMAVIAGGRRSTTAEREPAPETATPGQPTTPTGMRRCIGSARFGIEPHEAPIDEFPRQPSRKDGLGLMCAPHWRAYVKGLREARKDATTSRTDTAATGGEEVDAA